mgnify:FL=1
MPVAGQSSRRWSFKNWDTFYLSKPFGTITLTFGKPLSFSKESSFEECSNTLKQALDQLEEKVNKHVGLVTDS